MRPKKEKESLKNLTLKRLNLILKNPKSPIELKKQIINIIKERREKGKVILDAILKSPDIDKPMPFVKKIRLLALYELHRENKCHIDTNGLDIKKFTAPSFERLTIKELFSKLILTLFKSKEDKEKLCVKLTSLIEEL